MKKIVITWLIVGMILLVAGGVIAKDYSLLCLERHEVIEFSNCNPNIADRTCNHNECQYCVYEGSLGFACPASGSPSPCNALGLSCSGESGSGPSDEIPPSLTIRSPVEGDVYENRKVIFDFNASEMVNVYYSPVGEEDWDRLCRNCLDFFDDERLIEGQNNILIKAIDFGGNEEIYAISFFVDSKAPKIRRTLPKKRNFFDGTFWAQYTEYNLEELILHYGSSSLSREVLLTGCASGKKQECETDVDLEEFDGEEIEYWFTLEDIAGSFDESKHVYGRVDVSEPVVNNPDSFYEVDGKYVRFNLNITEENFDEVTYTYIDYRGRLKEKRLCSRLKDEGICNKKKSFRRGSYNLTVNVWDEAGNVIGLPANFVIDY